MFGSPFLNTLNVFGATKVVSIFFLGQPACLSCGLTRLAASWFTTVFLFVNVASIRREKITAILTLMPSLYTCHRDCLHDISLAFKRTIWKKKQIKKKKGFYIFF
jgi:hypothetical protein